ncbi:hypothetical protein RIF29_14176 [Crotalaria pallida]|uniref:DUF7745 domain-containing protein n=1 Tax=Crotalaria pallida TaxID=3830 RepID=A0AAN9IDJ4_CROPI
MGVSLVQAILADTFSGLTKYYIKQKGSILCYVQLLFLWVATYLHPARSQNINKDPILRFSRWALFSLADVLWREKLENATDKCYGWKSPWYKDDTVLMACGNFSDGLDTNLSRSFCLEGEEGRAKEVKFLHAWKNMKILGANELQQQIKTEVASYVAWRKSRTESFTPLIPFPKNSGPTSKEQSLQKKIEVLEAQLKETQIEKREIETIFSVYDREKEQLQGEETWKRARERDEWQKHKIEVLKKQLAQNGEEHTIMMSAAKNEMERIKEVLQNTNDFHDQCKIEFNEILKRSDEELAEARHQISFLRREYGDRDRQYASFSKQWLIDFDKARAEIDAPGVPWKTIRYFKEYDGMARLIRAKEKNEPEYTLTEYLPST